MLRVETARERKGEGNAGWPRALIAEEGGWNRWARLGGMRSRGGVVSGSNAVGARPGARAQTHGKEGKPGGRERGRSMVRHGWRAGAVGEASAGVGEPGWDADAGGTHRPCSSAGKG